MKDSITFALHICRRQDLRHRVLQSILLHPESFFLSMPVSCWHMSLELSAEALWAPGS